MKQVHASFRALADSTASDWELLTKAFVPFLNDLPNRILSQMGELAHDHGGFPVNRLEHCLQTATRAYQGGQDEEYVVCALLHDIGDMLAPATHADLAATILKPYVSPENHWMVEKHGIFQGYYFFHHIGSGWIGICAISSGGTNGLSERQSSVKNTTSQALIQNLIQCRWRTSHRWFVGF